MAEPALWVSEPDVSGEIRIVDPHDGSPLPGIPVSSEHDVQRAVATARALLPGWKSTPPAERGAALRRVARALSERAEELAETNHRETGRPANEALAGVMAGIATLEQYAEYSPLHRGNSLNGPGAAIDFERREPRGVAAIVTPWNDPVAVACGLIGAALVMGDTVVHKPSERCPATGRMLGDVFAGILPPGVCHTVIGGPQLGAELVGDEGVDVVAHVGSTSTGLEIARIVAATGAHFIRENGGNDALVIDDDVDADWAAEQAAIGAFTNSGQLCTSVERIYVPQRLADEFVARLVERADALNAPAADAPLSLAPLVDERLREAVHAHVDDAVLRGATVLCGGRIPSAAGSYYPATVLIGCSKEMRVMREETFGPLAPVQVCPTFEDALAAASDDHYGLAATVLTRSLEHALTAVDRLDVGTVKVNNVFGGAPGGAAQPRHHSGDGFGYGPALLDEMSHVKVVHLEGVVQ
jgi:acyl-CoA reductase-like NAD-dependent aldehyde dehydrogenase